MSHVNPPANTPNVRIENPDARRWIGNGLAWISAALAVAVLVDNSIPQLDYAFVTGPAALIVAGLFSIFQLGVTSPNVPR